MLDLPRGNPLSPPPAMELPPLPPINDSLDKLSKIMRGPTLASNWVIPGIVMAGAYPGLLEDQRNDQQLKCILNKGIDTFVCLQSEVDDEIPEEEWRAGNGLRPYFVDAKKLSKKDLIWRHLPIIDGGAADDDVMEALVCDLIDDVKAGRVLYVHCWGGHGRTGIVVCLVLAVLYGISAAEAFKRVQACHDTRIEPQGVKSPTTVVQRSQVKRLLLKWKSNQESPAMESALAPDASSIGEVAAPQMVVGANGARGFVVGRSASTPQMVNDESSEISLRKPRMKGQPSTQQPICTQTGSNVQPLQSRLVLRNSNSASQRQISMHPSTGASAVPLRICTGRAAGKGAAAVQMLRKSNSNVALR